MERRIRKDVLLVAAIAAMWMGWLVDSAYAQNLIPDHLFSTPGDGAKGVSREQGRIGLLFQFKFFNAAGASLNPLIILEMNGKPVLSKRLSALMR